MSLSLDRLTCIRGDRLLFERLDLTLAAGGAALVQGPNGVGKSSLLRMIAGLLAPAAGTVVRHGALAYAGEATALDEHLPLARALRFWARLDGRAEVPVRMLSTGQRRRALLARVIAGAADIWLLDEPGNGLDAAALDRLAAAMAEHRARGGIVVAASHQPLGLADPQRIAL